MASTKMILPDHAVRVAKPAGLAAWRPIFFAFLATLAMAWPMIPKIWLSGYYGDTDDALRMVQVRDLLAGQNWFDLTIWRINPPTGLANHWSRIVDIPLVVLIEFFQLFLSREMAERAARLAFSASMLFLLCAGVARAAARLAGERAVLPALALTVLSGVSLGQFQPGRIDHHAPQIVTLVFMFAFSLQALEVGRSRYAGLAGALAALSLGISIENLTFIVALSGFWLLLWAAKGEEFRKPLRAYGLGLLAMLPVIFLGTIGRDRWMAVACDAFSPAYLFPFAALGSGCVFLSHIRNQSIHARLFFATSISLATCAIFVIFFPQCLRGPLAGVDPLLRGYWLENVYEARNLASSLVIQTQYTLLTIAPLLISSAFVIPAIIRSDGRARISWLLLAALLSAGITTTFWQIRASSSLAPLACIAGVWAIIEVRRFLQRLRLQTAGVLAIASALLITPMGWAIMHGAASAALLIGAPAPTDRSLQAVKRDCFDSENYKVLATSPTGLVAAPIDAGAHILAHTHHSILAAAYHRNNAGNRKLLDIFFASPDAAEMIVRERKVDYVALCSHASERQLLSRHAPTGFGAALFTGNRPGWLREISGPNDTLRIYRVTQPP